MFCKYCGKSISEDAIFCEKCGKLQNDMKESVETNISKRSTDESYGNNQLLINISSFTIEFSIIVFSFMNLYNILFLSKNYQICVFDLFSEKYLMYFDIRTANSMKGFAAFLFLGSIICIVYFVYKLLITAFSKKERINGYVYYSSAAGMLNSIFQSLGLAFLSANLGEYVSVSPSYGIIITYFLVAIQFIINVCIYNTKK